MSGPVPTQGTTGACPGEEVFERLAGGEPMTPEMAAHLSACADCRLALDQAKDDAAFLTRVRTLAGPTLAPEGAPRIPGYGSMRLLSSGSQGMVYKAVQESTQRAVAIKVMNRPGQASSRQQHRAEREAEIAARLRHPNIVTVFESRTLGDGRIAVIMEFVSGVPIDKWATGHTNAQTHQHTNTPETEEQRSRKQVLRVFLDVCNAIHHAHLNGVIHRDVKPDNILVTEVDSSAPATGATSLRLSVTSGLGPRPVVLDFGIAKAGGIQATITGEFAGTPAYASPEQVAGKPDGVDALTDIYSLGVILYRLMLGRLPYTVEGSIFEIARTITEVEPTPPHSIEPGFPADLEAIILRALRKDKHARYQSAAALARDIESFLRGDPVEARQGSGWYLLRKAVSINRKRLALAAGLAAVVIGAGVIAAVSMVHASASAKKAQEQQEQAQAESVRARAVTEMLRSAMPSDDPAHPEVTTIVGSGLGRLYLRLETGAFADNPQLDQTLRRLWGGVYTGFGGAKAGAMVEYAEVSLRNGLIRLRMRYGTEHPEIAATLHELSGVLLVRKRFNDAESACREALAMREKLVGSSSLGAADSHALLARILLAKEDQQGALDQADAALRIYGSDPGADLSIAAMNALRGRVALTRKQFDQADGFVREALVRRLRTLPPHEPELLSSLEDAAELVEACPQCRLSSALASAWGDKETERQRDGEKQSNSPSSSLRLSVSESIRRDIPLLRGPDSSYYSLEHTERAGALVHLLHLDESLLGPDEPAIIGVLLEVVHASDGDVDGRAKAALRAADLLAKRFGPNDLSVLMCVEDASILCVFAGDPQQAAALGRRAMSIWDNIPAYAQDPVQVGLERRYLGWYLGMCGQYDEAISVLTRSIEDLTKAAGPRHTTVALAEATLANSLADAKRLDEADTRSRYALDMARSLPSVPKDAMAHICVARGHVLTALGRLAEAKPLLEEAWDPVYRDSGLGHPWARQLINDMVKLCIGLGDSAGASTWSERLKGNQAPVQPPL